jgi:RNA polymerase sigma-70 factor (ECF subfamily)
VGSWLPEPILTGGGALGPLETVEQRDSVSIGVLVMLERLTPAERAVFVLREAFGYPHREIAEILDIDEAHSRQLHSRAHAHVSKARKRFAADDAQHHRIVERFLAATLSGDLNGLQRLLADDVVSWADGGGAVTTAQRPIIGKAQVIRYLLRVRRAPQVTNIRTEMAEVNGEPASLLRIGDTLIGVAIPEVDNQQIVNLRLIVNPAKLRYVVTQLR